MENYKHTLAKLANQMKMEIATKTATPEQNELKKRYGRIFPTVHCTRRLAERNLEIQPDLVREKLIKLERVKTVLCHNETNTFIMYVPNQNKRLAGYYCL